MNKLFKIKYKTHEGVAHEVEAVCEHMVDAMLIIERYEGRPVTIVNVLTLPMKPEAVK